MTLASGSEVSRRGSLAAGPLFLIGMPRSGTKLLREMLNQHPGIRILDVETDFLPYWASNWARLMPVRSRDRFLKFHDECLRTPFFVQCAERGIQIGGDDWYSACISLEPAAVFEGLIRCCLSLHRGDQSVIWGDKSPSYVRHIPLLIRLFPGARIVHIVRDARDYGLSVRRAWGKSILRAVQRWQDDVSKARQDGQHHAGSYVEIRYEDLLEAPRRTLESVCACIGLDFDERMLTPGRIVENLGAARDSRGILRGNTGKYLTQLSPGTVQKIESIAGTTLRSLDYPCAYQGDPVRLPGWQLLILQCWDGLNLVRAGASRVGLWRSLTFNARYFKTSGNRR